MIQGEPGPLGAPAAGPATRAEVTEPVPNIHREDEPARWHERLRAYADEHHEIATLAVAFAVFSAVAAAGYVAGYRDGVAAR